MENIIKNVKDSEKSGLPQYEMKSGFDLARQIADEHHKNTGNPCHIRRILDYVDQFSGRDREFYSFDIVEIIT